MQLAHTGSSLQQRLLVVVSAVRVGLLTHAVQQYSLLILPTLSLSG
jgi:hypothetical protein